MVSLTDTQIQRLIRLPKRVTNPRARAVTEGKHIRRDFSAVSDDDETFVVFTRQSTLIASNFSAGLRWVSRSGEQVILLRCNGSDHPHSNPFERTQFRAQAHIHIATERYIDAGRKAEHFASPCDSYRTLGGALHELTQRANIIGVLTEPDHPDLFGQP